MDWWLIPLGIGVAVLLRFVWVAAFHPDETVSAMPELDGYVPGGYANGEPTGNDAEDALRAEARSVGEAPSGRTKGHESELVEWGDDLREVDRSGTDAGVATDDDGETWIELDITPLFPSSESRQIVDLTEAEDPEVTP